MCGRFTLHTPAARVREAFELPALADGDLPPRYNITPSQAIPIIRNTGGGRELVLVRWGLLPSWSKESRTKYSTINARIESVAEKPAYRTPFRRRRCLVPADGFYEWKASDGGKVPHHIRMKDGDVFAFAGLWDRWEDEEEQIESCTIIVMPANEVIKPIHARMPAILAPQDYDVWIDPGMTDREGIMRCLDSGRSGNLTIYPVSTRVNSPSVNNEGCIEPV